MKAMRLARTVSILILVSGLAVLRFATSAAADPTPVPAVTATVGTIASQLGVKPNAFKDEEFIPGVQFTGVLEEPEKLASLGIKGMHKGARVTVACLSPDRVLVDVDELEPSPRREATRLRLDALGRLGVASKT